MKSEFDCLFLFRKALIAIPALLNTYKDNKQTNKQTNKQNQQQQQQQRKQRFFHL